MKAVTVQEGWVDWPDMAYAKVGNIQLTRILGGDIRMDPAGFDIGIRDSWKSAIESVETAGGAPYSIPAGASDPRSVASVSRTGHARLPIKKSNTTFSSITSLCAP